MELYQAAWCPHAHKVRQRLTELGLDFTARQVPAEPDDLRTLTTQGKQQARELGRRFARKGVKPDAVISSPLLRARETAEGIASALGVDAEQDERLAPGATPEDVRAVVAGRGNTV